MCLILFHRFCRRGGLPYSSSDHNRKRGIVRRVVVVVVDRERGPPHPPYCGTLSHAYQSRNPVVRRASGFVREVPASDAQLLHSQLKLLLRPFRVAKSLFILCVYTHPRSSFASDINRRRLTSYSYVHEIVVAIVDVLPLLQTSEAVKVNGWRREREKA